MIKNIHHVGILVRDFDRMLAFYREAFGFETRGAELNIPKAKVEEMSGTRARDMSTRVIMMKAGNCFLEIMGNPDLPPRSEAGPAPGYTQLCVDVDDIDLEYARLKDLGMTFGSSAPVDFGHVKAVTGCDPEGNAIELVQTVSDWDCVLADLLPAKA
jgi:glyoxylase I family protein